MAQPVEAVALCATSSDAITGTGARRAGSVRGRVGLALVAGLAGMLVLAPAAGASNLVGNPGFEAGTAGWNTSTSGAGVTLERGAVGHSGGFAAKVTNTNATSVDSCLLNDSRNWVRQTASGSYTGTLWVRADTAGATLTLRLREYGASGTRLGLAKTRTTLTTDWQQVTVNLPVTSPGSTIDFNAHVINAAPGTCFYADDAAIINEQP